LIPGRLFAFFTLAVPVFAQYAGPAILSRGDAPTGMVTQPVGFTPNFEINGIYDTGLAGAAVNAKGELGNASSPGIQISGGISGNHSWKHTQLGLFYHGNLNHFTNRTYYDGSNQTLMLGITQQFTRHVVATFRETANMLSTGVVSTALEEAVPYDPSQSIVPLSDFIDNRILILGTQAGLVFKKSTRLSFDMLGQYYVNRPRAIDLAGVNGFTATGDVQYRVSLRTTIGADYTYSNFSYTRVFSGNDTHAFHATYATALSKNTELSAYGGVARTESKSEQVVVVDPVITALLGITSGLTVTHTLKYTPSFSARLSRTMHNGVIYAIVSHTVIPGNGLFLTSEATIASAGYSYTGLHLWSLNASFTLNRADTLGAIGNYGGESGRVSASRRIVKSLSVMAAFTASQYESRTFSMFNRLIYSTTLGLGWNPGRVPLRLW
jgi:hypothetical protein